VEGSGGVKMPFHDEDLPGLLCQYPIVVKHVTRMGPNRYRIDGPFDLYELCVIRKSSGILRAFVSDYAANRGFWRTQRFIRNLYGEPVVDIGNGEVLCLMDWFDGTKCSPKGEDTIDVAHTLARLHMALCGAGEVLLNSELSKTLTVLDNPQHTFLQQTKILNETFSKFSHKEQQSVFLKWLEEAHLRAKWLLPVIEYKFTSRETKLCWNITSFHDFIRFQNGRVGILQKNDPKVCNNPTDLALLAAEECAVGGAECVQAMIDAYREMAPLQEAEVNYVLACSAFPRAIIHNLQQGFSVIDTETKREKVLRLFEDEALAAQRLMRLIRFPM
jgi:hypothetical protein